MNYEFLRSIVWSKEKGDVSWLRHHDVVRHPRGAKKTDRRGPQCGRELAGDLP